MALDKSIIFLCAFCCLCSVECLLNLTEDSPCVTKGLNGTCVNIFKCKSAALTYIYTNAGFDKKAYSLRDIPDICSYNNDEPVVCCTDCEIGEGIFRDTVIGEHGEIVKKEKGPIAKDKCYEYFRTLPYSCRFPGYFRIYQVWNEEKQCNDDEYMPTNVVYAIGGRNAKRWEFPHMALIGYGDDVDSALWLCGGTVISEKFILTAAHCTSTHTLGNISFVALGLLKRTDPQKNWKIHNVKRIIVHPEYKAPSKYHDIALLETETKINFGKDLLPACLDVDFELKRYAEASGWGRLGHRQGLADTLQVVVLEEFTDLECAGMYQPSERHFKYGYDHEKQMCFGSHNEIIDTCEGDSGGPLHISTPYHSCQYTVIGVTSYGKDCGILGSAGMYTRVSYYLPWIESVVWPEETEARKKLDIQWLYKLFT